MARVVKRGPRGPRKAFRWRMPQPCADCPFNDDGPGHVLRLSLRPGRWASIVRDMLAGKHFTCHKTTRGTGDGSRLMCAGAIRFQELNGTLSNLQQIMERLEWFARRRKREGA